MAAKTGKKSAAKRQRTANAKKKATVAVKAGAAKAKRAVAKGAKRAKAVASNPRAAVRKAATNVHQTATRARDLGKSVVTAGQLIEEAADFVDSVAQRAKRRTTKSTKNRTKTS